MKQNITIKGRVELSKAEVGEAAVSYLSTEKKLSKAIDQYLAAHGLASTRVRYAPATGEAVADIERKVSDKVTHFSDDLSPLRSNNGGYVRRNMGIFDYLRAYLADESKAGKKKITLDEVYQTVRFKFPSMERKRLAMYLQDKRMLPNIKYAKQEVVL